ncbi:MAG: class I SAM-dependent methyltransferase [Oscillochloris sp.]|nr:class I SAM-dependent methyltransferase [Oscillochloris sp.]
MYRQSRTSEAAHTHGILIRQAGLYNLIVGQMLRGADERALNLAGVRAGMHVLDVGCGPGILTRAVQERVGTEGAAYGIDASAEMVALAKREATRRGIKAHFQLGVAEALPFPNGMFDRVVSRLVIHHLPGDLKARTFGEMRRVLKPGGRCLILDFDPRASRIVGAIVAHIGDLAPMTQIDTQAYVPLMAAAGFSAVEHGPAGYAMAYVRGEA